MRSFNQWILAFHQFEPRQKAEKIIARRKVETASTRICEYSRDETYGAFRVFGAAERIAFWPLIADMEELKNEIARRAVDAEKRGWEEKEVGAAA